MRSRYGKRKTFRGIGRYSQAKGPLGVGDGRAISEGSHDPGRRAWVVVRAAKLLPRVRRPLALMRMVRPAAGRSRGAARRIDPARCGRAYSLTTLSVLRS